MTQSNQKPSNKNLKRASVPGAGGSITVEAALSVPIFFFAVICLIYFIEIHNVQTTIQAAAVHAAKICTEDTALVPVLNTSKLESEIVRSIGAKRLENSIVSGGSKGIQCAGSYCNPNGNAFEERKAAARKLGEETSTRLLGPMFLMLGVVLMIIVVPAFLTIQI